ncbi:MAG: hypothetical protein WCC85_20685, partial [Candidatus Sulfotelmatobacter sp.]
IVILSAVAASRKRSGHEAQGSLPVSTLSALSSLVLRAHHYRRRKNWKLATELFPLSAFPVHPL